MANELHLDGYDSGKTVTATITNAVGTELATGIACAEVGSTGNYIGNMSAEIKGIYGVAFFASGDRITSGEIGWDGTKEIDLLNLKQANITLKQIFANVA